MPILANDAFVSADPVLHLLRRATFGPTPDAEAELRRLGAPAWLEAQLHPESIDDTRCDAIVARLPLQALDIAGVRAAVAAGRLARSGWDVMHQLGFATVVRAAWSRRQLFELVVQFWSNHLNVTSPSDDVWDSRQDYDRTVVRRYALGRFADLLKASVRHPAMLSYLDNRSSSKAQPNENHARELLELHTIGIGYTEADVRDAARLLTGLTVDGQTGLYRYDPDRHAVGAVTIAGFTVSNATPTGGEAAVASLLDYLAMHPATAERIARKLCVRFVADDPAPALVSRLARIYLDNQSAIVPVLRTLFSSPEFVASIGTKVRTPLEDLVATVRILNLGPDPVDPVASPTGTEALRQLYWMANNAGQAPMRRKTPDGYPDTALAWTSPASWMVRWNSHMNLATGWYPRQLARPKSLVEYLVPVLPATHGDLVDAVCRRLLGTVMRPEHAAALLLYLDKPASAPLKPGDAAITSSFTHLVALVLDSPYFSVR